MNSLAASLVLGLVASAQLPDMPTTTTLTTRAFGKTYMTEVSESEIAKTPQWDEEKEVPPVSPRKALKLAAKMKKSLVDNPDDFKLTHIVLEPTAHGWYWWVSYEARSDGPGHFTPDLPDGGTFTPDEPHALSLVVLMNGNVLKPTVFGAKNPERPVMKPRSGSYLRQNYSRPPSGP